jgi:hypothetical protein
MIVVSLTLWSGLRSEISMSGSCQKVLAHRSRLKAGTFFETWNGILSWHAPHLIIIIPTTVDDDDPLKSEAEKFTKKTQYDDGGQNQLIAQTKFLETKKEENSLIIFH